MKTQKRYNRLKAISVYILFVLSMPIVTISSSENAMAVTTEYLHVSSVFDCDFHTSDNSVLSDSDVLSRIYEGAGTMEPNPTAAYWENQASATNRSYLYWGNASGTGDTDADWGIGRAIFRIENPVGNSDYWDITLYASLAGMTFLSPSWHETGHYSCNSGIWSAFNLGVGYTDVDNEYYIPHYQMHQSAYQDSYWSVGGTASNLDQPPTPLICPVSGTNYWDVPDNSMDNRPWTQEEIENLVVFVDIRLEPEIFGASLSFTAGSQVAIALCGLEVMITSTTYSPPDYSDGFILRPDGDAMDTELWWDEDNEHSYLYDSLNETDYHSDYYDTCINTSWALFNTNPLVKMSFSLSNPPEESEDTKYYIRAWIIAKCDEQDYDTTLLAMVAYGDTMMPAGSSYIQGITETWVNYTFYATIGGDLLPLSLSQLEDLYFLFYIADYGYPEYDDYPTDLGEVIISQVAVICYVYSSSDIIDVNVESNINNLVWLLIVFIPSIALANISPRFGYAFGMFLMLIIFGISQDGFVPVSLVGFIALGIMLYKGGG